MIQALNRAEPELALGYVGVCEVDHEGDADFVPWFDRHQVDREFVRDLSPATGGALFSR